jgi:hypothetical protein
MLRKAALLLMITCVAPPVFASTVKDDETALAGIHAQRQEGNRICMSSHYHYGSSSGQKTRKAAEVQAIRDWAGFTAWEYGTVWGRYTLAASKDMKCSEAPDGTWGCHVEARPCRARPKRK